MSFLTADQKAKNISRKLSDPAKGWSALSLCIAKIVEIHWEEMRCTLQILHGQGDLSKPLSGVELLMPSMGNRHFMGGIPEIGDQCVVGWFVGDSSGSAHNKTPAILAWWPRASYLGHDWLTTQGFAPGEGLDTNKKRQQISSYYQRTRHKLRHYEPGNVAGSSSQGSDLVLSESVLLSNRRANEIVLRDQDQAIVMRSLQQFHAMSGARVYGGMVQRDARSLPKEMFSDGIKWDSSIQLDSKGNPFYPLSDDFEKDIDEGKLTPHPLFSRGGKAELSGSKIENGEPLFTGDIPPTIDPYRFLYNAGLVTEDFYDNTNQEAITYGGKSIFRVSNEEGNAIDEGDAFTEYRIELNHTTDGQLPVTEQTDGFDSDRLPSSPDSPESKTFIEFVLGTPCGNDPFSSEGASLYGIPLVPVVSKETGALEGANSETLFADHSATLLRITPILPDVPDCFSSFTKGGKYRGFISSGAPDAALVTISGGFNFSSDIGEILTRSLSIKGSDGLNLNGGVVRIEGTSSKEGNPLEGASSSTSVEIEGNKNVLIKSSSAIALEAPLVDFSRAGEIRLNSGSMSLSTGSALNLASEKIKLTAVGSMDVNISGPPQANALHGAVRKVKIIATPISGHVAGASDSYTNAYGGREEVYIGPSTNTKSIAVGTETKTIVSGSDTVIVGGTTQSIDPTGCKFLSPVGSITSSAGLSISLTANSVVVRGNGNVAISGRIITLGSQGVANGQIVCGSDIHPILGIPFSAFCPPRGQNLSSL
tara:strand:+ start:4176 stop:6464 length:2289 start_codon:yes stop_codon:yes gene_type:complete